MGPLPLQKGYTSGSACQAACPGGCLLNPDATTWTCVVDPCAPANPCKFQDATWAQSAMPRPMAHRIGDCKPGHGWANALNKTAGEAGARETVTNISQTLLRHSHENIVFGQEGGFSSSSSPYVRVAGNTPYYVTDLHYVHKLASVGKDGAVFSYDFSLGSDGDLVNYAASEDAILVARQSMKGLDVTAYAVGEPNTVISVFTVPYDIAFYNYAWHWPQLYGRTAIFVTPADNGPHTTIWWWDIHAPQKVQFTRNVTISGCNTDFDDLDSLREWRVLCPEDISDPANSMGGASTPRAGGDLTGCTLYFGAIGTGSAEQRSFCKMDLNTGRVEPLIGAGHARSRRLSGQSYPRAAQGGLSWHPAGLAYAVGSSTGTGPEIGDTMVYEFKNSRLRWINDEIKNDVNYLIADAFVNFQSPTTISSATSAVLVQNDILVYETSPQFGMVAFMAFNLTSKEVYPIALPYHVPNTVCGKFTYGGSCSTCMDAPVYGFTEVWPMANGSVVAHRDGNDPGNSDAIGLSRFDSSFILPQHRCEAGCSVRGGTCVRGVCYCQPHCSGTDCMTGMPEVCAPPKPPPASDDDDDY